MKELLYGVLFAVVGAIVGAQYSNYLSDQSKAVPSVDADVYIAPFKSPLQPPKFLDRNLGATLRSWMEAVEKKYSINDRDVILSKADDYDQMQKLSPAACSYSAVITNKSGKPQHQLKVTGDNVIAFALIRSEPKSAPRETVELTFNNSLTIPVLDPPEKVRLIAYTKYDCMSGAYDIEPLHIYTDDLVAKVNYIRYPTEEERAAAQRGGSIFELIGIVVTILLGLVIVGGVLTKLGIISPPKDPPSAQPPVNAAK